MQTPNGVVQFEQAFQMVREKLSAAQLVPAIENLPLDLVLGRVLAIDVTADRDYPPFHRAIRDGYAVRSSDVSAAPVSLLCVGEIKAGECFAGEVRSGQCAAIMTGAPLPAGSDAVVMVEHTRSEEEKVAMLRSCGRWENVVCQGSEAPAGARVLPRGRRLASSDLGLLATVGKAEVEVYQRPEVAILPTGDELVPVERQPKSFQIRNSNAVTLSAQVTSAGGIPRILPIAPDRKDALRELIEEGLKSGLLLLSGGVSAGKYDLVEQVLEEIGAEFFFRGVAMRPGKPLVFGRAKGKFFFGLPGNPVSTFVTFEALARLAVNLLGGAAFEPQVFFRARLEKPFRKNTGLTTFIPARVEIQNGEPRAQLVAYQGSGDLVGAATANCFLVVHPEQRELAAGDWVDVMPKPA